VDFGLLRIFEAFFATRLLVATRASCQELPGLLDYERMFYANHRTAATARGLRKPSGSPLSFHPHA
jgi:hypothetical protein